MRYSYPSLALFLVLGTAGCSTPDTTPSTYTVTGKVLLPTGAPARGAEVLLVPAEKDGKVVGVEASAILNQDGTFTLKSMGKDGAARGYYSVVVDPRQLPKKMAADKQVGLQTIPKKYWSEPTTDLKVEIDGNKTGWEIKLAN